MIGEMLVGIAPIHSSIRVEVFTDYICVLPQNGIPKICYIHNDIPLK